MAADYRATLAARRERRRGRGAKPNAADAAKSEPIVAQQRGGFGIAPGGVTPGAGSGRRAVESPAARQNSGFDPRMALKGGQAASKGLERLTAPGPLPSHAMSPATRQAFETQRAGERGNFGIPSGGGTPSIDPQWDFMGGGGDVGGSFGAQSGAGLDVGAGGAQVPVSEGMGGMGGGFDPSVSSGFGALGGLAGGAAGGYGLYQGIENDNPMQATMGGLSALQGANSASVAAGGPGLTGAAAGAAGGALGVVGGGYGIYSGIQNDSPVEVVGGAAGVVGGGASLAGSAGLIGASAASAVVGGATVVGATAAAAIIIDMLAQKGMPLDFDRHPTSSDMSKISGTQAAQNLAKQLPAQVSLPQISSFLNAKWSPNDELQITSKGFTDSPAWGENLQMLRNPEAMAQGQEWVDPFTRGLEIKYGETGNVNKSDPESTWRLQNQLARALPEHSAYSQLKADIAPGGSMWQTEQSRLGDYLGDLSQRPTQYYQGQDQTRNEYDPYNNPQYSRQFIDDHGINPYTYKPNDTPPVDASNQGSGEGMGGTPAPMMPTFNPDRQVPANLPQLQMQPFSPPTGGMSGGMGGGLDPSVTGAVDPGVSVGGAGKRSPTFLTPEIDNRAEAGGTGKLNGQAGAASDPGVPFGMAGKRPGGGMQVGGGQRPQQSGPQGNAPFGGMPRGSMGVQAGGGRPQPGQQRRNQGVV